MWRKMNTPNIIYWMNVLSLIRFVDVWENISFSWKHLIRYHTNHVVTFYICVSIPSTAPQSLIYLLTTKTYCIKLATRY